MRLVHLQANSAWAFVFGDQLVRLGDAGMLLFPSHHEAVLEARHFGFTVSRDGTVTLKENCK
jgi:hypothetical protein